MALLTVDNRSAEVQQAALSFEIDHLTHPDARQIGMEFARLAQGLILRIRKEDKDLVNALADLRAAREKFIGIVSKG